MLGDWVEFVSSKNKHHYGIGQIAGINPLEGSVEPTTFNVCKKYEDGKTCLFIGVSMFCVKPVSLTPEILKKNGFIIKKKWAQIGNFGNSPLIMWHFEDDTILHNFKHELEIHQNDNGKVHVKIPCEYVHELQHALKICKIDKEIEL